MTSVRFRKRGEMLQRFGSYQRVTQRKNEKKSADSSISFISGRETDCRGITESMRSRSRQRNPAVFKGNRTDVCECTFRDKKPCPFLQTIKLIFILSTYFQLFVLCVVYLLLKEQNWEAKLLTLSGQIREKIITRFLLPIT